ncbi:hypothetical protein SCG7086_AE_00060 [Chlamydiales bacterium SCGC AG-110-P3]|nr:hypothetical protein SCG7086_AE_00060 [Chlamydiales bacterium SCGC AG-110-P3]
MRLFVDQRSCHYFEEQGYIHFENLLSEKQLLDATGAADRLVARKMPLANGLKPRSPDDVMTCGIGIAGEDDVMGRLVRSRHLAEVVYELTDERPLRLGRDVLLTGAKAPTNLYLFEKPRSLADVICYQGMAGAVLIRLRGEAGEQEADRKISEQGIRGQTGAIPPKPGAGVFLAPTKEIDFAALTADPNSIFLLIVYLTDRAVYVANDADPTPYGDKRLGYGVGDRLRENGHPIVWR